MAWCRYYYTYTECTYLCVYNSAWSLIVGHMVPIKFNCVVSHRGPNNDERVCIFGPTVSNDGSNSNLNSARNMSNREYRSELCF